MALYKKVDLIEQNRSTFYINGKPKHVKSARGAI